jgi:uncharacterized membrane protein HdeD (DUF308 family)
MGSFVDVPSDEVVRGRWKWFVALGVVLAILGLLALWNAVDATIITTIFVGFLLVFGGIAQIVSAFAGGGSAGIRILAIILGVLYVIVGFNMIADPLAGAIALTIVVAIMLIINGGIRLFSSIADRTDHRLLVAVIGVIEILLGIWLWTGIPVSGIAIGFFVGLELLMAGILWIVGGWLARSAPEAPAPGSVG